MSRFSFSSQTEAIDRAGKDFRQAAQDLQHYATRARGINIPASAFPVDTRHAATAYEGMRAELAELMSSLQSLLEMVGYGLTTVAENYEACERQNGQNFTYLSPRKTGKPHHDAPAARPTLYAVSYVTAGRH